MIRSCPFVKMRDDWRGIPFISFLFFFLTSSFSYFISVRSLGRLSSCSTSTNRRTSVYNFHCARSFVRPSSPFDLAIKRNRRLSAATELASLLSHHPFALQVLCHVRRRASNFSLCKCRRRRPPGDRLCD